MDDPETASLIAPALEGEDDVTQFRAPIPLSDSSQALQDGDASPHAQESATQEGLAGGGGEGEGGETEDEMLRRRKAETLRLLDSTPLLDVLSPSSNPSFSPVTTSSTSPLTTTTTTTTSISLSPFTTTTTTAPPPVRLQRIPSSTSTSTSATSDDFGEFVDAPPSAALSPSGIATPTTVTDPHTPGFLDPLIGVVSTSTSSATATVNPPPPLPLALDLDPLSLPSGPPHPQPSLSSSSKQHLPLPPTPSTASAPPPPPPKSTSVRPSNLVDEVLDYERGGLSLFADPAFHSPFDEGTGESGVPPVPPPKPPSPMPPFSRSPLLSSRTATPTPSLPHAHHPIAPGYRDGSLLSPTPVYAPTLTPPNTAANPGGVFVDHPLAPSPSASLPRSRARTPPKVTTPHLPFAKPSSSASSSVLNLPSMNAAPGTGAGSGPTGEGSLGRAEGVAEETEIIAHHLGLIDHDYFSSREPADASGLAIPVPLQPVSRSRSRSAVGGIGKSVGSLLGGGGGSPSLSIGKDGGGNRSVGRGGSVGRAGDATEGRAEGRAAPPVMSSGGEWVWGGGERLGEQSSLSRGGGGASRERGVGANRGRETRSGVGEGVGEREGRERQEGEREGEGGRDRSSSPSQARRTGSYGTVGGLWGLWRGAPPPSTGTSASPEEYAHAHAHHSHPHTHSHHPHVHVHGQNTQGHVQSMQAQNTNDNQHGYGQHVYTITSPQPIGPTIVEDRPARFGVSSVPREVSVEGSTSASPEHQRTSGEYFDHLQQHPQHPHTGAKGTIGTGTVVDAGVGVQGRSGRPLPKARMSLESIQARWGDHGSSSGSAHSPSNSLSGSVTGYGGLLVPNQHTGSRSRTPSPARTRTGRGVPIDPPRITHGSPFAPPSQTSSGFLVSGSVGGLRAGFGDPMVGGLISSSAASSSSALGGIGMGLGKGGGGSGSKGNPFATHTFVPIPGAPGFRPEGYDWDKGFSEELERELERGGVVSPPGEEGGAEEAGEKDGEEEGEGGEGEEGEEGEEVRTPRVRGSPGPGDEKVNGSGVNGERLNVNGGEKVYPSGNTSATLGAGGRERERERERERDALRDRGRQPRPKEKEGKHKEREHSIYQAIGSAFGLWGSSSSSSASSTSTSSSAATASGSSKSAPRTPPLSSGLESSKSAFGGAKEKDLGYGYGNGHGRSATAPYFASSVRGEGQSGGGGRADASRGDGKSREGRRGEEGVGGRVNGRKVGELIERKVGGLEFVGRKESTVGVLGRVVGDKLRQHLPPLSRLPRTWTLLYSMDQHGISLNTLYTLCEAPLKNRRPSQPYVGMGGHILVIRDDAPASERDSCFGVYIADGLSRTKAKGFYGGGDSFLFRYHGKTGTMEVFHPTGRNSYYALCEKGYVAFGGGGSRYAVWVGEDLLGGSSAGSVCFGNGGAVCFGGVGKGEEGEREFEVVGMEVWGVGPA